MPPPPFVNKLSRVETLPDQLSDELGFPYQLKKCCREKPAIAPV